jgi:fatty acid-binding protein DegV
MVPVRLSFGDREYIDGVSLTSGEFYELLRDSEEAPLTSQPPAQDFSHVYSLLTSHGYAVISVGLSGQLSGTTAAAAMAGFSVDEVEACLLDLIPRTRVFGVADDLTYVVKGGRVPAWVKPVQAGAHRS